MQKPPGTLEVRRWRKFIDKIVLQNAVQIKPSQQPNKSFKTPPPLPKHLDKLVDQPWNPKASLEVDWWLWYCQREFEMVGGKS
jgi:hypothetical protein